MTYTTKFMELTEQMNIVRDLDILVTGNDTISLKFS